jgi:hypothetical protein
VYGADVCTWAKVDGDRIVEFGATVPMAAIENAPLDLEMAWPPVLTAALVMPDVVRERMGVHHLKLYWEAHGHPPGPYLVPHFDFHFYTISQAETDAIDCASLNKPAELPAGYDLPDVEIPEVGTLIGLCVPQMGMHALLKAELESDEPFEGTMVVGYYEEEPIFFEPMITQELLLQRQTFPLDFPAYSGSGPGVVLPTRFEAVYDESASAYEFVFSGFPSA